MAGHAPSPGSADPLSLHGVVAPTVTAFEEGERLDAETTAAHARYVVDAGVDAVFPLGTNGEFALLSGSERASVVRAVVAAVGGDVPVIAGVGAPATRLTVEHARAAVEAGADGVVVVTPYYYPLDEAGAVEHYRRVAEAVDRPVYVYHIPSRTGNALDYETLLELAALENVVGVKDSSKDVPLLGQAVDALPDWTFLSGSDSLLFAGLEVGCSGVVSAVANAFPGLVCELYEAYDEGDEPRARDLQSTVFEVRRALKRGPYLAGVKAALRLQGFDAGPLRAPLRGMDDAETDRLRRSLHDLGLL